MVYGYLNDMQWSMHHTKKGYLIWQPFWYGAWIPLHGDL